MRRFLLTDLCDGVSEYDLTSREAAGFSHEELHVMFQGSGWTGFRAGLSDIADDPELLGDVDIWLAVDCLPESVSIPDYIGLVAQAQRKGVVVGMTSDSGYLMEMVYGNRERLSLFQAADFIYQCRPPSSTETRLVQRVIDRPYLLCPHPYDPVRTAALLGLSTSTPLPPEVTAALPGNLADYYICPHYLNHPDCGPWHRHANYLLTVICQQADIPLLVTRPANDSLAVTDTYRRLSERGPVDFLRTLPRELDHHEFVSVLARSRGVIHTCPYPTEGRATLWATLLGKPSLTGPTCLQQVLYPELHLDHSIHEVSTIHRKLACAGRRVADANARLSALYPAAIYGRWIEFLTSHFWRN